MRADDRFRLGHMVDALEAANRFILDRRREDLNQDQMLAFALVRAVEIVGEAASKVSTETREQHPQVPWLPMVGMRNRLVHAYYDVNLDILWTTVTVAVPELLALLHPLLTEE